LRTGLIKKDWFLAVLITLTVVGATLSNAGFLQNLERVAYDAGVRNTHRNANATDDIAIVAIDEASIAQIGRFPWSRKIIADMIEVLAKAQARVVGLQIFLTEPQEDPGLAKIREIRDYIDSGKLSGQTRRQLGALSRMLRQAEIDLDVDRLLAKAIPAGGNVYMPMFFNLGPQLGEPDGKLPEFVRKNRLTQYKAEGKQITEPVSANAIHFPLSVFGERTAGIGHLNVDPDTDGGIRTEALVVNYFGEYYPSLAMILAARSLNLSPGRVRVDLGRGVGLGKLYIDTDSRMRMYTGFYPEKPERPAFSSYSFVDVLNNKIPSRALRNKIVIVGPTAPGIGNLYVTPVSASMNGPSLTANMVASILNQDFYTRPEWTRAIELGLFVAVAIYLIVVLPRFNAGIAALLSLILLIALIVAGQYMLLAEKIWLQTISAAFLLLVGHILLTTKRFLSTERLKAHAESDSAQTNRMLGLTFQSQGQLDMAYDKFRKLPVDESVLELVYNLALDFERKRQLNKAGSCYDYILGHDRKFRDVAERKQRAVQAEGTIIIGGSRSSAGGTLIVDGNAEKPTLGRYKVEAELGRGAMGTVYLGRDPKINRTVAIKTMDLSAEFADSELDSVKERFFREAETAGRLNHPNIVTIYDAGEEHDLAYIAMEYLEGKDLTDKIKAGQALPVGWALDVVAQVADALDYAHRYGVVHRDIKPANIMYNDADQSVKVTDFGIARITDSSKTKTGVVLGTPSYMSPEQFSGKKVDGRSDLFSLGVTLFELVTGEQPFNGDSLAELMYQITNARHPNPAKIREDLPACVKLIIDKALQKEIEKRFQTGDEFAKAVRRCRESI
jgi:serine/threonine-protein kinase